MFASFKSFMQRSLNMPSPNSKSIRRRRSPLRNSAIRNSAIRNSAIRNSTTKSLHFEPLESRDLLTVLTWTGAADNVLNNANNWSPVQAPGGGDDLVFGDVGAGSLTLGGNLLGITSVSFQNTRGNNYSLSNGTLTLDTLSQTGGGSNTLNVTLDSLDLTATIAAGRMRVSETTNGIFAGTWNVLGSDTDNFQETWTVTNEGDISSPWQYGATMGGTGTGAYFTNGTSNGQPFQHTRLTSPTLTVTENAMHTLSFDHRYSIEGDRWDAGAVFLSLNDGPFTQLPNASFTANGYNQFDLRCDPAGHVLCHEDGFGADSPNFPNNITSVANLGTLTAGDSVAVQFLMANDWAALGNFNPSWALDRVQISAPGGDLLNEEFEITDGTLDVVGGVGESGLGDAEVNLAGGTLNLVPEMTFAPGLQEGTIAESNNTSDPNPANSAIVLGISAGQTSAVPPWGDNVTYVYTGQFFDVDGMFSFAEYIDDNAYVSIDGNVVLSNTAWDIATTTGVLDIGLGPAGDGWHDIDIRVGNGGGPGGAVGDTNGVTGWSDTFGIGYHIDGSAGANGVNDGYIIPADPGDGSFFRVPTA
ncbi:MAG: hypothetical protein ACI9HK_005586, partial [Pirellulaceae bacterium]